VTLEIDRAAPVGILGSTPEFRDLLYECGFEHIYVLDRNTTFYVAMSNARLYRNHEEFIKGDWCDTLPKLKGTFSLLLSDLTSGNIAYADRAQFYNLISDALAPKGIFCDKVLIHDGPNIKFDSIVEKYSQLPLNLLYINYFSCEMLFCSELLDIKQLVDTADFYSIIEERVNSPRVRAFARYAKEMITPSDCIWYYGRKWGSIKHDYCPDLKPVAEYPDDPTSPYYGRLKFFTFRKM